MPVARRQALLRWAEAAPDRYILEDDYDSEFRFSGRPIPALQSLDGGERVVYLQHLCKESGPFPAHQLHGAAPPPAGAVAAGFLVLLLHRPLL